MNNGLTITEAAEALGISARTVFRRMKSGSLQYKKEGRNVEVFLTEEDNLSEVITGQKARPRRGKIAAIEEFINGISDTDTYDVAKRFELSPVSANNTLKKISGVYSPIDNWIQKCAKSGVKFSFLKLHLKITSLEKAKLILKEHFPGCFISEVKIEDDILLTPIPDSSNEFETLFVDTERKHSLFTYYVAPSKNYMYVKFNDNLPGDEIKIWNFTDLHIGYKACREGLLKNLLSMADSDPTAFIQFGGDTIENSSRQSAGHPFDQTMLPGEQVSYAAKLLAPYSYKAIDYIKGNHEERAERFADTDITLILGQMLKVPTFNIGTIIEYEWRGVKKIQFHTHRYGNVYDDTGVKKEVRKILSRLSFNIDAFSSGHTHESWSSRIENTVLVSGRGFEGTDIYIINGGSTTADTGTYSEKYGRSPKDLTYFTIHENGTHGAGSFPIKSI